MKNIFLICLSIFLVVAASGIAYHFFVNVPKQRDIEVYKELDKRHALSECRLLYGREQDSGKLPSTFRNAQEAQIFTDQFMDSCMEQLGFAY